MAVPVLIIALTVPLPSDPPRWLMFTGRREDAIELLANVRRDLRHNHPTLLAEVEQLKAAAKVSHHKPNDLWGLAVGRYSGNLRFGRRVWMGFALQLIQQWTGILAIAT